MVQSLLSIPFFVEASNSTLGVFRNINVVHIQQSGANSQIVFIIQQWCNTQCVTIWLKQDYACLLLAPVTYQRVLSTFRKTNFFFCYLLFVIFLSKKKVKFYFFLNKHNGMFDVCSIRSLTKRAVIEHDHYHLLCSIMNTTRQIQCFNQNATLDQYEIINFAVATQSRNTAMHGFRVQSSQKLLFVKLIVEQQAQQQYGPNIIDYVSISQTSTN